MEMGTFSLSKKMIDKLKTLLKRGLPKCNFCHKRIWPGNEGVIVRKQPQDHKNYSHWDCYVSWEHEDERFTQNVSKGNL